MILYYTPFADNFIILMEWIAAQGGNAVPQRVRQALRSLVENGDIEAIGPERGYLMNPDIDTDINIEEVEDDDIQVEGDVEVQVEGPTGLEGFTAADFSEVLTWVEEPFPFVVLFLVVFLIDHFLGRWGLV